MSIQPLQALASMPFMPLGPGVNAAQAVASPDAAAATGSGGDFGSMLSGAMQGLNGDLVQADSMQQQAAAGQLSDPTQAIVQVEKADIELQLATQVRNKLVEGWQELSRMQV